MCGHPWWLCLVLCLVPDGGKGPGASALKVEDPEASQRTAKKFEPPDVSSQICWVGSFTKEKCCQGDSTTSTECWDEQFSFAECCPNADCWDGDTFTYKRCCDTEKFGEKGNPGCWSGIFTYEHCCLANETGQSWVDVFTSGIDTAQFYGMDEFYTDAQYGEDFGYYSTGRVLRGPDEKGSPQEFAHYTTYPMALSPHFGRVMCRVLFVMWVHLGEREPFRVVEMGAGSGQLAADIRQCVRTNELGIAPKVWRRWTASFEYLIIERSPALARRQRQRGLRVVAGDAQTAESCRPALVALAESEACHGATANSPECAKTSTGTEHNGASVVLSNELIDAFAPIKLRLSVFGNPNVTDCKVWQEIRFVHIMAESDLLAVLAGLFHTEERAQALLTDLRAFTTDMFCKLRNSTVGQAATECLPQSSCLAVVFGLSELMSHADLQLPSAAHNMRLRLRKDVSLCQRLRDLAQGIEESLKDVVVLPRLAYRQLRHQLREVPELEVAFLTKTQTRQVPVPLSEERCESLGWWMVFHEKRVDRLVNLYRPLGYPAIQLLVRPGERNHVQLADCLLGPRGGFMLAVDYGANFEALGHSLSVDAGSDGVFIPPVPHELLQDLPDCYGSWTLCAGRVDWTTFVDFTNIAAAGEELGWRTLFYGPQSLLEQMSRRNLTFDGREYSVPGYSTMTQTWVSRHVQGWYGREVLGSKKDSEGWQQRWTSFKTLLLEKPPVPDAPLPSITGFPSWHLDSSEADPCWTFDPSALPLADWIQRHPREDPREAMQTLTEQINEGLGRQYSEGYEELQLAVRLVDWFVATEGCENFRPLRAARLLESEGLWQTLKRRLMLAWGTLWGDPEVVERVTRAILERIADTDPPEHAGPVECAGWQTYVLLCEEPGGGARTRESMFPDSR